MHYIEKELNELKANGLMHACSLMQYASQIRSSLVFNKKNGKTNKSTSSYIYIYLVIFFLFLQAEKCNNDRSVMLFIT